jgi:hypothetical protein
LNKPPENESPAAPPKCAGQFRWALNLAKGINMTTLAFPSDLFQWAELQARLRRPVPVIVRRIAIRSRISNLHAAAFIEANGIGPAGAR